MHKRLVGWVRLWVFIIVAPLASAVDWVNMERVGDVAHFYVASPAQILRYDIAAKNWLTPITLPTARGALTAATVDADGIYVAYSKAVYRYNATGGAELHVINTANNVQSLFTDGNLLLINHTPSYDARFISVNKANNTVIATHESYTSTAHGAAIGRGVNRIFGTSRGLSPADIGYIEYRDDGTFVGGGESPHHGDYSIGARVWVFPNATRITDSSGNIYDSSSIRWSLSFGTTIDDLAFHGTDIPIVLKGNRVTAYNNAILPTGSANLTAAAKSIVVHGDEVIAFRTTTGSDIGVETLPLSALSAATPGQPVDPNGLAFVPDNAWVDRFGTVHLFSKAHQTVFRWDAAQQAFISGIPLIGGPDYVAYSSANDRLYTAYNSGLIRKIELIGDDRSESPFAQLATRPRGLTAVGTYLFAGDDSGAWMSHYTYSAAGTLVSSKDWNYYSQFYVWSDVNQKIYFLRDDTSPNDLLWEEINANGTAYPSLPAGAIGNKKDSPYHGDSAVAHPIRVSPNGQVVSMGSGMLHDAITLSRLTTSLANTHTDAVWKGTNLYSIRAVSDATQFQEWVAPTYALGAVKQISGTPRRILLLSDGNFLAILSSANGAPAFYVLDAQFNVVAPATLAAPVGLAATVKSTSELQLTWHNVTGAAGYSVERRTSPSGSWAVLSSTGMGVTSVSDASVQVGTTYEYRVTATNGTLSSSASAALVVPFTAPSAPVLTASLASASQVKLDWAAVPRASSYRLSRSSNNSSWSTLTTITNGALTYTDSYLISGATYYYRLEAINALGTSTPSASVSITLPQTPPDVPYLYSAYAEPGSVSLSWSGGSRAESHRVERSVADTWETIASVPSSSASYVDTSVAENVTYNYRLIAVNSAGESAPSSVRTATVPALPTPTSPGSVGTRTVSATSIELFWADAFYETSYRIERRIGEAVWTPVGTAPGNSTSYVDTTAVTGTYYNYRVVAVNVKGEAASMEVSARAVAAGVVLSETFDPGITGAWWTNLSGASVLTGPKGFGTGNALWMGGDGPRVAQLVPWDLTGGGSLRFRFRAGNTETDGATHWENSEPGETVVVEYSTNGTNWVNLAFIDTVYPNSSTWTEYNLPLPTGARSATTRFRWYQVRHSGAGFDTWALDDIQLLGLLPDRPAAPPFLMGVANSSRSVALSWTPVARATHYVIQRRASDTTWTDIGTVGFGQSFFSDLTVEPAQLYSYRVIARNGSGDSAPSDYTMVATWSTIAEWRFQNYGTISNSGLAASLQDNGTGIPNLLRYAFNMSATDSYYVAHPDGDVKGMPNVQWESSTGRLQIAFIRRRAARNPGIVYTVEFSDNLQQWAPAGEEILAVAIDTDFEFVVWEDAPSTAPRLSRFARVRVSE